MQFSEAELIAWIRRHHFALQTEWAFMITVEPTPWDHLEFLHTSIVELERELPWLKNEARA